MSKISKDPVQQLLQSLTDGGGELILCRCCTNPITRSSEALKIGVSDHYRFTNAAGISYSINCFKNASGCSIAGTPTNLDSWFNGYRWQLAHCCECHEHIGWYYQNIKERYFFGLIQDRLIKARD